MKSTKTLSNRVLFLYIIFSLFTFIHAANYYVDKDAKGLNNGTSWINAWETTDDIDWTKLDGGDFVYFSGGLTGKTYPLWKKDYNWGNITGGYATFTPSSESGKNGTVTFYNSTISTSLESICLVGPHNIILKNFRVLNANGIGEGAVSLGSSCSNIILDGLKIEVGANGKVGHCIILYNCSNITVKNCSLNVFPNSINNEQDGIICGKLTGDILLENNYISLAGNNSTPHRDGIQLWSYGDALRNVTIRNNFIIDACSSTSRSMAGIYASSVQGNFLIYNNIIKLGGDEGWTSGIEVNAGIYSNLTLKAKIYNNTIVSKQRQNILINTNYCDSLQVKNNLLYCLGIGAQTSFKFNNLSHTSKADINYNQLYRVYGSSSCDVLFSTTSYSFTEWKSLGYEAKGEYAFATFVNSNGTAAKDFKLKIGSQGIDEGFSNSAWFMTDKDRITRPKGTNWDRGAFEYVPVLGKTDTTSPELVRAEIVNDYVLFQNYPNPFNPTTMISYTIPSATLSSSSRAESRDEGSLVTLKVFDVLGNEVATLVNETVEPGNHTVLFDAAKLASGVYIYTLSLNNSIQTKKMILMK